jgi:beta-lactamase class A
MRNHRILALVTLAIAVPLIAVAQHDSLRTRIERVIESVHGKIGVCVVRQTTGDTLTVNGDEHFPMQSVYKFPLALAVLQRVDSGKLSLNQTIHLTTSDLHPDTWSPLREKYPKGNVDVRLDTLLAYTVGLSDNNGCDVLFRLMGGPSTVNGRIHRIGVAGINIQATEAAMHADWNVQYTNWSTPAAMGQLLAMFDRGTILSPTMWEYLWWLMVQSPTGLKRLKGLLPEGTVVAHKTGSSGTDEHGVSAATNDAGIIVLPNGEHVVVVVFMSGCTDDEAARDSAIAKIAQIVWAGYQAR